MSEKKIWAKGLYYKEIPTKSGSVRKLSFQRDKFIEWLNGQEVSDKGYLSVNIWNLKEPDKYGNLFELVLDTFKPDPNYKKKETDEDEVF